MEIKVYVPQTVEIPDAYIPALARRLADCLGPQAATIFATRGHLIRQAVQDGLLRQLDHLIAEDGSVDLVCDPGAEIPLELDQQTLTLEQLLDALQMRRSWNDVSPSADAA